MIKEGDKLICKRACCFDSPWIVVRKVYFIKNVTYRVFKIDMQTKTISMFAEKGDFFVFSFTQKK